MGGGRRPEGSPGRSLSARFDLRGTADAFAAQLSDLLNNTLADGVRVIAVTDSAGQQARIAPGLSPRNLDEPKMVPVALSRKPRLFLGMLFRMAADDAGKYPMIRSSVMFLSPDEDGSRLLLHYDYERDKADDYPDAHLQVCATSAAWEEVTRSYGPKGRELERLHLPVGGRRFRPTIEDLIEFLIVEQLATEKRRNWRRWVDAGRARFEESQLRAAVRRNPDAALAILREEGHIG